jgi:hypothetical protein
MADQSTFANCPEIEPDRSNAEPPHGAAAKHHSILTSAARAAERELGAFISVVTDLYGPEQARSSAEDWLDELESIHALPKAPTREWRLITIAAAARLAGRLTAMGLSEHPGHAR